MNWASDDAFLSVADRSEILTSDVNGNPELVIGFNDYVADEDGVDRVPDCGCDFCDYGSDVLLQQLDSLIFSVIDGSIEAQSGGRYSGYRTSFDAAGEFSGDTFHRPALHRSRPWFPDWTPRPMQDWA